MSISRDSRTFTARWVFPVSGAPLANGTITIRGEVIESVDAHGVRTPDEDLGNAAIVPGFVNPHAHLDLSGARGLIPPTDPDHFTDWLRGVIAYRQTRTFEQTQADIRAGLAECLKFGTTLIGDIASEGASWDAVSEAKTRAVVFFEMIGLSEERFAATLGREMEWRRSLSNNLQLCRPGRSPHAPYSAGAACYVSIPLGVPSSTHLAETKTEAELLEKREGAFVQFLKDVGAWDGADFVADWEFIAWMSSAEYPLPQDMRRPPALFAHCNYLSPDIPFSSNQSIVYCPRTHAAFRHPPHPFREFLQRGVRVCLGTDSLASNPDLDILAEARFVHAKYPDFPGDSLLKMITLCGAEALGWANETGSLKPGKSADFVAVPLPNRVASDPHELLFADHAADRRTMFRGEWR